MEYRIEHLDFEIRLAGKGKPVNTNRAFKIIPTLWSKAKKEGFMQELIDMSWENPKCSLEGILGVCGKEVAIMHEEFTISWGYDMTESLVKEWKHSSFRLVLGLFSPMLVRHGNGYILNGFPHQGMNWQIYLVLNVIMERGINPGMNCGFQLLLHNLMKNGLAH